MAQRVTQKTKGQAVPPRKGGRAAPKEAKRKSESPLAALERERDQLKAQLDDARAAIAKLEHAREEALNRIDWAIDSLHNVLESGA